jgi:hypothetical protein
MAFTTISVTNGVELKKVPLGFSWTVCFFVCFVPLIRQDWMGALVLFILCLIAGPFGPCVGWIAAFFYNKNYAKRLFSNEYRVAAVPNDCTTEKVQSYLGFIKLPMQE